ncbi:hypothetical protein IQ07DRAFT_649015 [Pyrenochaeta sp. DS3sAY3a]|nr:hypothetical protein IQ07DRAFT_649015 [Pyrenochaeta sp. DS3sAY3a]
MAASERLERLRNKLHAEVNALPDRAPSPDLLLSSDEDDSGGISLEPLSTQIPVDNPVSTADAVPPIDEEVPQQDPIADTERRFVWIKDAPSQAKPNSLPSNIGVPAPSCKLPVTDLQRGDLASNRHQFCPIQALAKFPYKFCNKVHMQAVASAFFDHGKFFEREWDLYYVWDNDPTKPLVLVRENQVHALLQEVNTHLDLSLRITDDQREQGLITRFPDHPRCRPRYLGRSNSRTEYDNLVEKTPGADFSAPDDPACSPLDTSASEHFELLMEDLWDVTKAKNKAAKAKKQQERLARQRSMAEQLKRAQRYLGLRPIEAGEVTSTSRPQAIDPTLAASWPFDQSVVFVSVDVESYERAHSLITEIGVATLDTRDLVGIAPGADGAEWRNKIQAQHFRIKEHRHFVNHEFVHGCPDHFEFGSSTLVALRDAPSHIAACFRPPFGATPSDGADSMPPSGEARKIVLLGHDTASDIRYLKTIDYDPLKDENVIEVQDTAAIYQAWRLETQPTSLGRILADFGIPGSYLHNAGNDAVYTLQVLLAVCVREATIRGDKE